MTSLQGLWKSFKEFLKFGDSRKEVPKALGSRDEPTKKETLANKRVKKESPPIIRLQSKQIHLQVGLDFGTHATKIVYSQIGRRLSKALNLKHNLPNYPNYCLPSVAAIEESGKLVLGTEAAKLLLDKEWDAGLHRLKVIVAGNHDLAFKDSISHDKFYNYLRGHGYDDSFTAERLTAIYLAYAMKKVREIIKRSKDYADAEIDIAFNICVPIDHIENNKVKGVFERIFAWAEAIEGEWQRKDTMFDPVQASYDLEGSLGNPDKRVFAVPEAVAEIASYLVSLRKREGLHAVIDLGAGTTDVSICNLFIPSEGAISYWYAARNIPRGTINVERRLASYVKEETKRQTWTCVDVFKFMDNLKTLSFPQIRSRESHQGLMSCVKEEIETIRNSQDYYRTWGSAYKRHLKKESAWERVEIFVSGGGANLPYVGETFSVPWWNELKVKYPVSSLPTPDDYVAGDGGAPFSRMSVAYGLARPIPELDDYVLPGNAPDHTPPPLPTRSGPDRDDLYPK